MSRTNGGYISGYGGSEIVEAKPREQRLTRIFFTRGRHLSYQRSKHQVNPNTSLIKIDGVDNTDAAK